MIMALTYGPLNDIDLFAWSPPDGGGAHEVALSFKHTLKNIQTYSTKHSSSHSKKTHLKETFKRNI